MQRKGTKTGRGDLSGLDSVPLLSSSYDIGGTISASPATAQLCADVSLSTGSGGLATVAGRPVPSPGLSCTSGHTRITGDTRSNSGVKTDIRRGSLSRWAGVRLRPSASSLGLELCLVRVFRLRLTPWQAIGLEHRVRETPTGSDTGWWASCEVSEEGERPAAPHWPSSAPSGGNARSEDKSATRSPGRATRAQLFYWLWGMLYQPGWQPTDLTSKEKKYMASKIFKARYLTSSNKTLRGSVRRLITTMKDRINKHKFYVLFLYVYHRLIVEASSSKTKDFTWANLSVISTILPRRSYPKYNALNIIPLRRLFLRADRQLLTFPQNKGACKSLS